MISYISGWPDILIFPMVSVHTCCLYYACVISYIFQVGQVFLYFQWWVGSHQLIPINICGMQLKAKAGLPICLLVGLKQTTAILLKWLITLRDPTVQCFSTVWISWTIFSFTARKKLVRIMTADNPHILSVVEVRDYCYSCWLLIHWIPWQNPLCVCRSDYSTGTQKLDIWFCS